MKTLGLLILVIALSACTSREERQASYVADCQAIGFTPGTEGMGNCVLQKEAMRRNSAAAGSMIGYQSMQYHRAVSMGR